MSDDVSGEIDSLVGRGEPPSPRPTRKRAAKRQDDDEIEAAASEPREPPARREPPQAISEQEQDLRDLLPKELPPPQEKVKTLGEMVSRYKIGQDPQFRLQVYRLTPKFFPGGIKADGYYDEYDIPLTQDMIASEYGGGQFRVKVVGPEPSNPTGWKHYDSVVVDIAGEAKQSRRPRASQVAEPAPAAAAVPPAPFQVVGGSQEDPKLAQAALNMSKELLQSERDERRRIEDRVVDAQKQAQQIVEPIIEAHKMRADDVLRSERERAQIERRMLEERLAEEKAERRRLEERFQAMENQPRVSVAEELGKLMAHMPRGDDGQGAQRMLEQVLDKHRMELESIQKQHQLQLESIQKNHGLLVESLRESHRQEMQSMRESHARQLEAERETFRNREERAEQVLAAEREERRRDREMFQRSEEQRDRQWKDRLENQEANIKAQYESRLTSTETTLKTRIEWLQAEIDKKDGEISDLRTRLQENADPVAQFEKLGAFRDAAKNALGIADTPPPSPAAPGGGGIGMGEDWKAIFAEGAAERLPAILQAGGALVERMMGGQAGGVPGAAVPQAQPQLQLGQRFVHPQYGDVVVVQDPARPGQLGLQPYAEWAATQQRPAQQPRRTSGGRGLLADMDRMSDGRQQPRKRGIIPNFAEGLPRPNEPGEPVHPPLPDQQRRTSRNVAPPAQQQVEAPTPPQPVVEQSPSAAPQKMGALERRIAHMVAQAINDSVMRGDEPEEFVTSALQNVPRQVLVGICQKSTDEVIATIREIAPQSGGATPAGEKFVRQSIRLLREQLGAG